MYDDWVDCPHCDEGFIEGECTCMEDCCACAEPDPPACDHCDGKGGWNLDSDDEAT